MMPLSDFHSAMKGKQYYGDHQKMTSCSPAAQSPFMPEHDFMELLWENGQVVMQGQTNRPKRGTLPSSLPLISGKPKEKEARDAATPKACRYGFSVTGIEGNELQATGTPGQIGLGGQDDEMVPWLNCPIDDYCSEFLSEFSGVSPHPLSTTVPADRISGFGAENSSRAPPGSSEHTRMNNNQLFPFPQQFQSSGSSSKLKESDTTTNTAHQTPTGVLASVKLHKQDSTTSKPMQPNSSTPVMNFSHFTRPVALVKANLLSVDRVRSGEKVSTAASTNPVESTLIQSASGLERNSALRGQVILATDKVESNPPVQRSQEMVFAGHSEAICLEDAARNSGNHKKTDNLNSRRMLDPRKFQDSNFKASVLHQEPAIAPSSLCSANGPVAATNDVKNRAKRKCQEGEESEYASEDHEDDSMDVKRPITGQSMKQKRSRAAEVHNLSERRRRDRINEKMRALQELIPNCNKVDKASMLDEAIEYLKTLQMQVQIMSMGGGLCVPPMMLSTGLQHIRAPHMGPFSPMGVGMGMGMGLGFGMGMLDMTRSPLMSIPRIHGPQYPCPSIPGTPGLHGLPSSSSLQMFGIPGQTLPMSMPHPPHFIPFTGMTTNVNTVPEEAVADVSPTQASDSALRNSKDQQLNTIEQVAKTTTDDTPAKSPRQENEECFELPSLVHVDNQHPNLCGCEEIDRDGIHLPP